jgi:hypothetical protein
MMQCISTRVAALGLIGLTLSGTKDLAGQYAGADWHVGGGVGYEVYNFGSAASVGIESLSLLTTPFAARSGLFGASSLTVSGSFAAGTLTRADGSSTTISGLTDTNVQVDMPVGRDAVVLTAIVALPTGKATQTLEEAEAAGAFAADLLPFRVSNWGTGGRIGLATSFVHTAGDFGLGLSVGYSVAGEFELLEEDERAYRPGNEIRIRAAVDRTIGRSGKAALQVTAYRFGTDELGGQNLYQSGNRYSAIGSYAFAAGQGSNGILYTGLMHRANGTFLDVSQDAPSQDLILAGGGLRLPVGTVRLLPSVDARVFRSADGAGQGYATSVGASAEMPAGTLTVVPSLRGRFGNVIVREGQESGFTGADVGLMIRFGGR